ncbi:MAG TPA: hypothetical protein VD860_09155 [Azospirillum sp.]|nr:hypothetical protein [Azospirillum sp.]
MIGRDRPRRYHAAVGNSLGTARWAAMPGGDKDGTFKTELAFFVVERGDDWLVRADGFVYGPYASFVLALRGAVHEAQAAGDCGFASLVLVQASADQPYEAAWTYGRDSYPLADAP